MRIGIELNGVLRNTLGKIEQTYQKYMIEKMEGVDDENSFKYELKLPITSLKLSNHLMFENEGDLYSFLYEEFPMEIFGHSQSTEYTTFNDLNEQYVNLRDSHDLLIMSDEIGKSKPSSLFFLSKFGCQLEKIKFYSNSTINSMWNEIDVLLTANPTLLLKHPEDKLVIKYETIYNQEINTIHKIKKIKELEEIIKQIATC